MPGPYATSRTHTRSRLYCATGQGVLNKEKKSKDTNIAHLLSPWLLLPCHGQPNYEGQINRMLILETHYAISREPLRNALEIDRVRGLWPDLTYAVQATIGIAPRLMRPSWQSHRGSPNFQ